MRQIDEETSLQVIPPTEGATRCVVASTIHFFQTYIFMKVGPDISQHCDHDGAQRGQVGL